MRHNYTLQIFSYCMCPRHFKFYADIAACERGEALGILVKGKQKTSAIVFV